VWVILLGRRNEGKLSEIAWKTARKIKEKSQQAADKIRVRMPYEGGMCGHRGGFGAGDPNGGPL